VEDKPARYAASETSGYRRFDETGNFHGTNLAGDRLAEGEYQPMAIDTLPDGRIRSYSTALNLILEWHKGN